MEHTYYVFDIIDGASEDEYKKQVSLKYQTIISELTDILNCNFYIAGGYASSKYFNVDIQDTQDIDLYFYTEQDYQIAFETITSANPLGYFKYSLEFETNNARSFKEHLTGITIQIIHKYFGPPEVIIENFDLNKSQVAYLPKFNQFISSPSARNDLTISFKNFNYDTLKRVGKYIERGYVLDKPKILCTLNKLWLSNKRIHSYYIDGDPLEFKELILSHNRFHTELDYIFDIFFSQELFNTFNPWIYERANEHRLFYNRHLSKCYSVICAGVKYRAEEYKEYYSRVLNETPEVLF